MLITPILKRRLARIASLGVMLSAGAMALAQTPQASSSPEVSNPRQLSDTQTQVSDRFKELKALLLRMAELTAPSDPRRAALLRQAVAQANQENIETQFATLVALLQQDRLSQAIKGQGELSQDLNKLLDLLLSEDRSKRLDKEKQNIRQYIKFLNALIKRQKVVQGQTAGDGDPKNLSGEQAELADQTGDLARRVGETERKISSPTTPPKGADKHDSSGGKPSEKSPSSDSPEEKNPKKSGDQKPGDKPVEKSDRPKSSPKIEDKASKPGDPSGGEPPKSESGKPSDSKPSEGPQSPPSPGQSPGQSQGGSPNQSSPPEASDQAPSPVQQRLQQARQRMIEAQHKLDEARRNDARDRQEEAIRELQQAKAELEEILRQLREEEIAHLLALLEQRFKKMLEMQIEVYDGTKRLDKIIETERDRDDEIESGRLSRREAEIAAEAQRAMSLLQDDGTAVAFPEAVSEMQEDMEQVMVRLAAFKVGKVTQNIEEEIIAALEEMIAALKKAQRELKNRKSPPSSMSGEPQEEPLVDQVAELKMIRALQMRVNSRTQRYGELIQSEQADQPDIVEALQRLAEREERIHRVTHDIVVGKNK